MAENFEKVYGQQVDNNLDEKIGQCQISDKDWRALEIIAKRVGGDFGMKVRLGEPGSGSFFNPEDCSITFDPLHIRKNPELAKFVAGHEGAHRAITPGPKEIGISDEQVRELYSQIGFGYLQNVIEDPAVNDWMQRRFPGLIDYTKKAYDEQFKEENAILSTPEVQRIALQLGYWPRFVQYGSEVIRHWHQGEFSEKLDSAVKTALERTIKYASESIGKIPDPDPQKLSLEREEIVKIAQERFYINTNDIWPEVEKLVEMDLHTEEQRQMMQEIKQKQKELEQKKKELEEAKAQGDKKKQGDLEKEIEELEKELNPFNNLPDDVKKELEEQIDKAIREAAEKLSKEIEKLEKQIEETKARQKELEKEIKNLEEKIKQATGQEREELKKQLKEKQTEKLAQEKKQKELEDTLKDFPIPPQGDFPIPFPADKLSDKTKQELEKLFKSMPRQKREELTKKAQEQLEDFEDKINEEMEGKLNKDKPESHRKRREREEREREIQKQKEQGENEQEKLEEKLKKMLREKMTEYDKVYEEVSSIINSLYVRLKRFFLPERHPKWRKGYPTGSRIDLGTAMQAEADPRYLEKIWERKTIPRKFDYRFSILVDTSGSMEGEKIEETFKGLVVLAETLEKLGVQNEIIAFSDSSQVFKEWKEKLNKEKRDYLVQIKSFGGGGTATTEATQQAYEELLKNLGKENFLITLTDGQPNDVSSLEKLLNKIREEGKIKLVGVGLGPDTEFVKNFYNAAFSIPKVSIAEEERRQGKKDFSEIFAELLEDMIRHPEKY